MPQRISILFLVPDLFGPPGGIARYCHLVCQALQESGFELTVIGLRDKAENAPIAQRSLPGINYWACSGSRPALIVQAMCAAARSRPTLLLIGHPNFSLAGWLLSRIVRTPWVVFIYGIDVFERLPQTVHWALQQANLVISISHFTAQRAAEVNGVDPKRIRILHNCLDSQFKPSPTAPTAQPALSLLTVGRLSQTEGYKGHDRVIGAMPELLVHYPNLTYNIVGDGDGRTTLEQLAVKTGVSRAVRFHGRVTEAALRQHYLDATVFVMPSSREGFGFVFLEAMAYGCPAIGGNLDATPEVILDGETGYLVDPNSVDAIAGAAARLLADRDLRERMGKAAARHVAKNFGYQGFKERLLSYLASLDAGTGRVANADSPGYSNLLS